jgi:SAM-dependent methyltransferase/chorismate mutase
MPHRLLELNELGERIHVVDEQIMRLVKARMGLSEEVIERKMRDGGSNGVEIVRASVEDARIADAVKWAKRNGLNPHFAAAMMYAIINESCKHQMTILQGSISSGRLEPESEAERFLRLKQNLLHLTEAWAPSYDGYYQKAFPATRAYLAFEKNILDSQVGELACRGRMLDLGCATGNLACSMAGKFERVVGYDLSSHMINAANSKVAVQRISNVEFREADLEDGIPEAESSASLAVMNLGTASDVPGIEAVIKDIYRVLMPGGRFFLSFYNKEALLYRITFLPWESGLAAMVNIHRDCLGVHATVEGKETILQVYARAYTVAEVRALLAAEPGLQVGTVRTHPTVSAVLPATFLSEQPEVEAAVVGIDDHIADGDAGAYITVTGWKGSSA